MVKRKCKCKCSLKCRVLKMVLWHHYKNQLEPSFFRMCAYFTLALKCALTDESLRTRTPATDNSLALKDAFIKYLCVFQSYFGMAKMTDWWGESRASRFKSPSADVRKWWVSCVQALSYSQTKLNEEGLIWPECPALLNRTLSLRALLRDNVCFVSQSSERGWKGTGGPWEIQHGCCGN